MPWIIMWSPDDTYPMKHNKLQNTIFLDLIYNKYTIISWFTPKVISRTQARPFSFFISKNLRLCGRTWRKATPTWQGGGELGSARKGKMVRRVILLVGEETSVFRGENIWNFYLGLILGQGRVQCILRKCARDHVWVTVVQLSVQEVSRDKASLTLEIQIRVSGPC